MNTKLPDEYGAALSVLTDEDLRKALKAGFLLDDEAEVEKRIRQASYELTLGEARTLDDKPLRDAPAGAAEFLEGSAYLKKIGEKTWLHINPMQCCLLYTREKVINPPNVIGRVTARGQLFQSGLIVESTYVDPGFGPDTETGKSIHLMAFNATNKVVRLPLGTPIARLELMRMSRSVGAAHPGRRAIRRSEVEQDIFPWPSKGAGHNTELTQARRHRDDDQRLLTMDRHTYAIELACAELEKVKGSQSRMKLVVLVLVAFASYQLLAQFGAEYLPEDWRPYVKNPIAGLSIALLTFSFALLKKGLRDALKTGFGVP